MKLQINIHETYHTIEILSDSISLTDVQELNNVIQQATTTGTSAIILIINNVENISTEALQALEQLHDNMYNNGNSLAFAMPTPNVLNKIKQERLHLVLNICPTTIEAVDIISMELLERDLLNEED